MDKQLEIYFFKHNLLNRKQLNLIFIKLNLLIKIVDILIQFKYFDIRQQIKGTINLTKVNK